MRATLEFDLPEEDEQHLAAVHAMQWKAVVFMVDQILRRVEKHGEWSEKASEVRDIIRDAMLENGVSFD